MTAAKPYILIHHRDDDYRAFLTFLLEWHELEVRHTANAEKFREYFRAQTPALVIVDWSRFDTSLDNPLAVLGIDCAHPLMEIILLGKPPSREHITLAGKVGLRNIVVSEGFEIESFIQRIRSLLPKDSISLSAQAHGKPRRPPSSEQNAKIQPSELRDRIRSLGRVPVAESTVNDLLRLVHCQDTTTGEIANVVLRDAGATLHLLSRVNTADVLAGREYIANVGVAIQLLGMREFHDLIESLPTIDEKSTPQWNSGKWIYATRASARLSQLLSRRMALGDPGEFAAAALLHDIGAPTLAAMEPDAARQLALTQVPEGMRRNEFEKRALGVDHAQIGGLVLEIARLPQWLIECVSLHHTPPALRPPMSPQSKSATMILQATDQILAALAGDLPTQDILEGLSEEFTAALEHSGVTGDSLLVECATALNEVAAELASLQLDCDLLSAAGPSLDKIAYLNPRRQQMDLIASFVGRHCGQISEINLSQLAQTMQQKTPLLINLCDVRGESSQANVIQHLVHHAGARGALVVGENIRPGLVQGLSVAGWLCTHLPAPVDILKKMLTDLAARSQAAAA